MNLATMKKIKAFYMKQIFTTLKKTKKHLLLFIEGARVKTLPAILVPVALSSAWAFYQTGIFEKSIFFFTILSALFIQISTNFFNDALDAREGIDSSLRKGPERLVQSGKTKFFPSAVFWISIRLFVCSFWNPSYSQRGLAYSFSWSSLLFSGLFLYRRTLFTFKNRLV